MYEEIVEINQILPDADAGYDIANGDYIDLQNTLALVSTLLFLAVFFVSMIIHFKCM